MMNQLLKSRPPTSRPTTCMMMSLTSESTILPKAPPMITPTAKSTTLPLTANSRNSFANDTLCSSWGSLDRVLARFAGANAHDLFHRGDKNLAVADLAGARSFDDGFDRPFYKRITDDHFDLDLGQEIDNVFCATIKLGMTLLTPKTFDLGDGQPGDAHFGQRLARLVQLKRLDDRFDLFHKHSSAAAVSSTKVTPVCKGGLAADYRSGKPSHSDHA